MTSRDRATTWAVTLAIIASIFAIGGAPRWGQAIVAFTLAAAVATLVSSRRVFARRAPLIWLIGCALALSTIQLIPLPRTLLDLLQPVGSSLRDDGASLVGTSPGATVSLDPPATLRSVVFFLCLLTVALICLRMATSESGRYRILATVALLCGGAALLGGIHHVLGLYDVYGLYQLHQGGPSLLGPLINSNHYACLLAVGSVTSIGLLAYVKQPAWRRAMWLAIGLGCAMATMATLSRGGTLGLAAGGFVALVVLLTQRLSTDEEPRRRRRHLLTQGLPIGVVAVCAVVVVLYASAGGVAQQFTHTTLGEIDAPRSKFAAWRSAPALISESPWLGIGRGALEPVFTRVHPASAYATYAQLENEYLQAVVDWGIPGALALALLTAWLFAVAVRRWNDGPLAAGALGAVVGVALQSNVDFGIEILGVAAPITAVVATLSYVPIREGTNRELGIARAVRIGLVGLLLLGGVLLRLDITTDLEEDHLALARSVAPTLDELRNPIRRHPLDYYTFMLAARTLSHANDPRGIRLLNHALSLHPTHPGLHLLAANLLYNSGHVEQATVEYAMAMPAARDKRRLLGEVVARFPTELAAAAIHVDQGWTDEVVRTLEELRRPDVANRWLALQVEHGGHTLHSCELLYDLAARYGDPAILSTIDRHCSEMQPRQDVRLGLARTLAQRGLLEDAVRVLGDVDTWQGRNDEKGDAWLLLCDCQFGLRRLDDAKRCLRRLDGAGLIGAERGREVMMRLERVQQAQANDSTGR